MKEKKTYREGFILPKKLHDKLQRIANEKGLSKTSVICLLIADYKEEKEKEND